MEITSKRKESILLGFKTGKINKLVKISNVSLNTNWDMYLSV